MSRTSGRSLPELLVALTLMGACLTAVAAASLVGARWTVHAVLRQQATQAAVAALDSLLASTIPPGPGASTPAGAPFRVEWAVESPGGGGWPPGPVTVLAVRDTGDRLDTLAALAGLWAPAPPLLEP